MTWIEFGKPGISIKPGVWKLLEGLGLTDGRKGPRGLHAKWWTRDHKKDKVEKSSAIKLFCKWRRPFYTQREEHWLASEYC